VEAAPEPVSQRAEHFQINFLPGGGLTLHALTRDRDGSGTARKLALALGQAGVSATKVADDLAQHVSEPPRPPGVARRNDVQPLAIGDRRPRRWRAWTGCPADGGHFLGIFMPIHGGNLVAEIPCIIGQIFGRDNWKMWEWL
jgi:hypothetical protein